MLKLGCFGSVVALNLKSETCKNCAVVRECAQVVFDAEQDALDLIEQVETKRENDNATLFKAERHSIDNMPDAAFHKVTRFFKRRHKHFKHFINGKPATRQESDFDKMVYNGIQFEKIKEGINPFRSDRDDKYKFMEHAVDYFIDNLYVTRGDIAGHYSAVGFAGTIGTRKSLASRALKILTIAGIIKKEGRVFCPA